MKRYLRTALFIYVAFCLVSVFWWMFISDRNNTKNEQTISDRNTVEHKVKLITHKVEPIVPLYKLKSYDRRTIAVSKHLPVQTKNVQNLLPWQWKERNEDKYIENIMSGTTYCNGSFLGYDRTFAKLTDVIIDPSKGSGRRGGENISEVLNQPEANEYFTLNYGYFKQRCNGRIHYLFNPKSHVSQWLSVLETSNDKLDYKTTFKEWTIAVMRYEYVNFYHTLTDFYNAFLVCKAFQMSPGNITILWIDGHPSGTLDSTWETLFGHVLRAGYIQQPSMFSHMIWGIMGYDSLLSQFNRVSVPYLEEFRDFFLSRHAVSTTNKLNCSKLRIMFLWRRDYVAHPRNPSGSVSRKIANENELLERAKKEFPNNVITGLQIDKLNMHDQLNVIASLDILIGMHGAGLSHTLFLPQHAGLIELFPTYWTNVNRHFESMARWRNLHYLTWSNFDSSKELPNHLTIIDVDVVTYLISQMIQKLC